MKKSDSLQSIDSTSFTKDYIKYKSSNDLSIILNNFEKIKQFLNYRKVYVTRVGRNAWS